MQNDPKKIILSTNLKSFFFEGLSELNKKSLCPIPEPIIYYSSNVLDKFALSDEFFETSEGKVREKVLGIKLLEATQLPREEQKKIYREVGEMSLMVCGYFSESVNKKILDTQYYAQLGKIAYSHLNNVTPKFLDIPHFYGIVATCFESLTTLMTLLASKEKGLEKNPVYLKLMKDENLSQKELLASGIVPSITTKVS
jgi:hypothetical protein